VLCEVHVNFSGIRPSSDIYCLCELGYAKEINDARKKSKSVGNVPVKQRNIVQKLTDIASHTC
jgi:hypothetical protein